MEIDELVGDAEVLILAIPLCSIPDFALSIKGKIDPRTVIVETTNYWPHRDGRIEAIENGMVNSVWVQQFFPQAIVKAFSNIGAYSLATGGRPNGSPDRIALAISSDHPQNLATVSALVDQIDFDPLNAGSLEESWRQQACGPAYCTDLDRDALAAARLRTVRESLEEKQQLSFGKTKKLGQEFFDILISGHYPSGFVDHAVDINREINGLPKRDHAF